MSGGGKFSKKRTLIPLISSSLIALCFTRSFLKKYHRNPENVIDVIVIVYIDSSIFGVKICTAATSWGILWQDEIVKEDLPQIWEVLYNM